MTASGAKAIDTPFWPTLYFAGVQQFPFHSKGHIWMQADWSLADVWERNKGILEGIVKTILLDHSLVDDVLQDAYTQVMITAPELEDEQEAYNYARKAVINTAINQYRRCRRNWAMVQALQKQQSEADERTPLLLMMEGEHERVESAVARELATAVSRLSPERRHAIELVLGRTDRFKDICRETGIPYTTLRSRFISAVDQIRKHMRVRKLLSKDEEVPK
ncbi:MAG: sigma-70 family RNA polymerase sigma factor [Acidobacteria bacterium]|nr:MAG: sigma-70 family RNA polymerase sigma factor [Acidobacteriota bacterium]